ncbi:MULTISPECIES: penicillin-binding protein activator [Sphingomonas]|uniref:Penicillin-binding protein activator n=1 Tax=Sphingomonas adhaesiva TaxID=28212 RepID=A0A2A4I682_9SPHN|nr:MULTISPECIES: penicillin-binding protein activator [Sphingomonas]PCG13995.1 penicillin-binding protein activator [Sphingomonas adhaesiva]PZU82026.1 MAG: penicillin-binding protein activator [Sphingomonas sp.]
MAEAITWPQRSRALSRWVAGLAAILLSACSTVVPRAPMEPGRTQTGAQTPRPTNPEVVQGLPQDVARNRVALLVPLSGGNAGVGKSLANATQLALLDTRNQQVRITNYDTAPGAAQAARRAIADGAQLILGPLLADDVRAVAPIARAAGVPVLSFSNDVSVAGNGAYLLGYAPAQAIERVVAYASGKGISNFGGLVPNALYGSRASTAFLRAVEDAGGRVVSLQTYDRGAVGAAVQRMAKDAPFGAVLIADSAPAAAAAVPLLRRASPSTQVLGTELWNSDNNIAATSALNGAWFASVPDNLYRQYARNYRARFGAAPYRLSSLGYDSVLLVVRIARDWRAGTPFPEGRLRDSDGFAGIDGAFRFGRDGVAERALEVKEIRGGATVTVSAAPTGFGK